MEPIDLTKQLAPLYTATHTPQEVVVETGVFLVADGHGAPGGDEFQYAVTALYSALYAVKFALKHEGRADFKVGRLECLYFSEPEIPLPDWQWRLMVRVPPEVESKDLRAARLDLYERKQHDISLVERLRWKEGRAVQVLHIGPYDQVSGAYQQIEVFAREQGLHITGPAHEIYLSDPRRTAAEKLRTIVRLPAKRQSRSVEERKRVDLL